MTILLFSENTATVFSRGNATAQAFSAVDTPVALTTDSREPDDDNDTDLWSNAGTTNLQLKYIGSRHRRGIAFLSLDQGEDTTAKDFKLHLALTRNAVVSLVTLAVNGFSSSNTGFNQGSFIIPFDLEPNDIYEPYIENLTNAVSLTDIVNVTFSMLLVGRQPTTS